MADDLDEADRIGKALRDLPPPPGARSAEEALARFWRAVASAESGPGD